VVELPRRDRISSQILRSKASGCKPPQGTYFWCLPGFSFEPLGIIFIVCIPASGSRCAGILSCLLVLGVVTSRSLIAESET